jgi:hypothetical protein
MADGRLLWTRLADGIGRGAAAIGLVRSPSRPESGSASTSAAVAAADQSVPHDWVGIVSGERFAADFKFPCIGTRCAGRDWCPAGTQTQGFRDFVVHFEKETEWQHMCAACADP